MYFFTADLHMYHKNVIRYSNRPFINIEEMHEKLIENWNKKVKNRDTIYVLGDFSFQNTGEILDRLNGKKILIPGDHDKDAWKYKDKWKEINTFGKIININGQMISLCHWCQRVWKKSHYNSWHLFGHSHGRLEPIGKSWDVGVDMNIPEWLNGVQYSPYSFDEIAMIMKNRPDNFNKVCETK